MSGPISLEVRQYLAELSAGAPRSSPIPATWSVLASHGVVTGTIEQPRITPAGQHVLRELTVRSPRTDSIPLLEVAGELDRLQALLDDVGRVAEYFISDLGPVVPIEVLPLLKPVAVNLATRRRTPEELSEAFREAWGAVEVLEGSSDDRLLAAELLEVAGTPLAEVYSSLSALSNRIREVGGSGAAAISSAALLLDASRSVPPRSVVDLFLSLRDQVHDDVGAALLARTLMRSGEGSAEERWRRFRVLLRPAVHGEEEDARRAAIYLTAVGAEPEKVVPRIQSLAMLLSEKFRSPVLAAALLTRFDRLPDAEILDWFDKAFKIVQKRRLASSADELHALALGILPGLQGESFLGTGPPPTPLPPMVPAIVTLHLWIFRPLIRRSVGTPPIPP